MEELNILEGLPFLANLPKNVQIIVLQVSLLVLAVVAVLVLRFVVSRIVLYPIKRWIERSPSKRDDMMFEALYRPINIAMLGIGIGLVVALFDFGAELENLADDVVRSTFFVGVMFFFYNLVDVVGLSPATLRYITGIRIEERLLPFLRVVLKAFILVMGFLIVLQEFGYNVTGLIASFGVVGLAFSLAAQDTAANFFGFTAIVSDNPFKVGDYIVFEGYAGTVEHVGVRSTRVRQLDQSLVSVPNRLLTDAPVTNWSRLQKRRFDFNIGLTYSTTSQQMRDVLVRLRERLQAREQVDPESVIVHFIGFGDSALHVRIICYVLLEDWGEFTAEAERINLEIMEIVETAGLSMAFPSRTLYIEGLPNSDDTAPGTPPLPRRPQRPDHPALEPTGKAEAKYQDNESDK